MLNDPITTMNICSAEKRVFQVARDLNEKYVRKEFRTRERDHIKVTSFLIRPRDLKVLVSE